MVFFMNCNFTATNSIVLLSNCVNNPVLSFNLKAYCVLMFFNLN